MKYESIAVKHENFVRAGEMLARELTAATNAGYKVDDKIMHHYDPVYNQHTLVRLTYKP